MNAIYLISADGKILDSIDLVIDSHNHLII